MKIIEVENLTKKFKDVVFEDCSFKIEESNVYLLLGTNGSGKSTIIKTILGLYKSTRGKINIHTNKISYVPEFFYYPDFISIYSFLYNLGSINNKNKVDLDIVIKNALDYWKIDGNKKLHQLSKGMRQKVLLIQALMNDNDIYIFDEPLNGLDVEMKDKMIDCIINLKKNKKTVIIITHEVNEFKNIYDFILEIKSGTIYEEFN